MGKGLDLLGRPRGLRAFPLSENLALLELRLGLRGRPISYYLVLIPVTQGCLVAPPATTDYGQLTVSIQMDYRCLSLAAPFD